MKQIVVMSKDKAVNFTCDHPWAAISVATREEDYVTLATYNRRGLLRLAFHDMANPVESDLVNRLFLFSQEQAEMLLLFVDQMWPQIDTLLVHCEAGRSRSPAIAAAVEYIWHGRGEDQKWFNAYMPNHFVYKTILETHFLHGPNIST